MPFENEHACRVKDPGDFIRFRRQKVGEVDGKRLDGIIGFKEGGGSELQAFRYPLDAGWSAAAARTHCKSHDGSFEAAAPKTEAVNNMHRTKVIRSETKVVDAERGLVHAVVSTEAVDRDGDIIRQSGWDLVHFLTHPILLSSHDYHHLRSQIGEWEEMQVKGKRLEGIARYYIDEGNEEADWGFNLAAHGRAAFSVGFIPDMEKAERTSDDGWFGTYEFKGQELLEVSHVTVPSNPQALAAVKAAGVREPALLQIIDEILEEANDGTAAPTGSDFPPQFAELVAVIRQGVAEELAGIPDLVERYLAEYHVVTTVGEIRGGPGGSGGPSGGGGGAPPRRSRDPDPDYEPGDPESTVPDDDDYGDGDPPPEDQHTIAASVETALREALAQSEEA